MTLVKQNQNNKTITAGTKVELGSDTNSDTYYLVNGVLTRLGIGSNGTYMTVAGGIPTWTATNTPSGSAGGDLTGSYPNPTIAANAVSYSKIQNVTTARLLGRVTAGSGVIEELTASQGRTLFGLGTAALLDSGLAVGNVAIVQSNGKIDPSILPAFAASSFDVVADQAARLALTGKLVGAYAKQTDTGITYILSALPASTNGNWVSIGDVAIDASDIQSGTIATARLGSGTANSSTFLAGDSTYKTVSASLPITEFTGATGTLTGTSTIYLANRSGGVCDMTLPATAVIGTQIQIIGNGAGGWRVSQNASQLIHFGDLTSITGTTGYIASALAKDCVTLVCVTANTTWVVQTAIGNLDINV